MPRVGSFTSGLAFSPFVFVEPGREKIHVASHNKWRGAPKTGRPYLYGISLVKVDKNVPPPTLRAGKGTRLPGIRPGFLRLSGPLLRTTHACSQLLLVYFFLQAGEKVHFRSKLSIEADKRSHKRSIVKQDLDE